MRHFFIISLVLLTLTACSEQHIEDTSIEIDDAETQFNEDVKLNIQEQKSLPEKNDEVAKSAVENELVAKITNLDLYTPIEESDFERFESCELDVSIPLDETKKLNLTNQDSYNLTIYASPNTDGLTQDEFQKMISECQFWEGLSPLTMTQNHLLWFDQLSCGYEVGELWGNETEESKRCNELMKQVLDYKGFTYVSDNTVLINNESLYLDLDDNIVFSKNFTTGDSQIYFGPDAMIPEAPTDDEYTRPAFLLKLVPKRDLNEIQQSEFTTTEITLETINDISFAKWEDSSFCKTLFYEIFGKTKNIQLRDISCDGLDTETYFDEIITNI